MFKDIIEDIKLSKLSYLLETILLRKMNEKIRAFNKIKKMKITKEMGLKILEYSVKKYDSKIGEETFCLPLISLCLENYYDEYAEKIKEIFDKLDKNNKTKVLTIISFIDKESAVRLYSYLVLKYFKDEEHLPFGTLSNNEENYEYLFPELYKSFEFKVKRNNILILLNDFVNKGIVRVDDLKKNKKYILKEINKVLKEGIDYKFSKKENFMNNEDYINLRFFLESAINIEYYISTRESKKLLDKLFTKKDNQLKLFILENYIKKNKKIDNININGIAKDKLSRYPLYNLLMFYNLERLMPKKYCNTLSLSESDLYINYAITKSYSEYPINMSFYKEIDYNNYKYYVYKFKVKSAYKNVIKDYTTNYLLETSKLNKYSEELVTKSYIGISGGFNKDVNPSLIELNPTSLMVSEEKTDIDSLIYSLLPKEEIKEPIIEIEEPLKEEIVTRKKFRIFSFKTLFLLQFLLIITLFIILVSYVDGYNVLKLDVKDKSSYKNDVTVYKKTNFNEVVSFDEINGHDIFNKEEEIYYVLLFNKKDSSEYYTYITYLIENGYRFYFVDTEKEENKFLFYQNELNFVLNSDRLLKVNAHEYEFYVDGKTNILKELRTDVDIIKVKKLEEEQKQKEELKNLDNKKE